MLKNQLILTANRFNPGLFMEQCFSTKTVEDAEDSFVDAKERLLDVNHWGRYCSAPGVTFSLSDGHNRPVSRRARGGDHIKLSIPGSEVCCLIIESLEYDDYPDLGMEAFTLRLKPCQHSKNMEEDNENEDLFPDMKKMPIAYKEVLITGALLQIAAYTIFFVVSFG
jgi:hypothetical protein